MMNRKVKPILFYSNYCNFSKVVLDSIKNNNLEDDVVLACIDTRKFKIPSSIDRVPALVTEQKQILFDNKLSIYLNEKGKEKITKSEIAGFDSEMSGLSDNYSMINNDDTSSMVGNRNFVQVGQEDYRIYTPVAGEEGKMNETTSLDKLMESRQQDIDRIMKS